MPHIHLVEGPVGAGKSTFCLSLSHRIGGVHIALDEWFAKLFSPDRPTFDVIPWYMQRKARLLDHIWNHALQLLAVGATPVLELGLIDRESREDFYQRARAAGIALKIYLIDASRETRRERVARRNIEKGPTFAMVVPEPVFEMASDMWQCPDDDEVAEHHMEVIYTDLED
jgi:predicted kinase